MDDLETFQLNRHKRKEPPKKFHEGRCFICGDKKNLAVLHSRGGIPVCRSKHKKCTIGIFKKYDIIEHYERKFGIPLIERELWQKSLWRGINHYGFADVKSLD